MSVQRLFRSVAFDSFHRDSLTVSWPTWRAARKPEKKMVHSQGDSLRNRLLMAIPPEILDRLSAQLEGVALERRAILIEPGVSPAHLYFPDYGLVSLAKTMSDGRAAEVGTVGPEGMVGVAILVGMAQPMSEAQVQVDGAARRLRTAALIAEVEQSLP
jgi:CRP-like cAMP-binding protein